MSMARGGGCSWIALLLLALVSLLTLVWQPLVVRLFASPSSWVLGKRMSLKHFCDPFSDGEWVNNASQAPLYKPGSCPFVEVAFGCSANGRPDSAFTHWSWRPHSCALLPFDGRHLLEHLRGKRMVFVGDSLSRNQWESMLCLLFQALPNRTRVVEASGQALRVTKEKGDFHFIFQERRYFYRVGDKLYPKLNLMVAFKMALRTWAAWVDTQMKEETARVFLVGYSPGHFRDGSWNRGGECQSETQPIANESQLPKYPEKMQVIEEIIRCIKFPVKLLNITRLSSYRSDGHPSIYGFKDVHRYQDCSHWCLPGVPDVWNILLYYSLVMDANGSIASHGLKCAVR